MQQRELAQRVLEHRLDQREESLLAVQETHRLEVNALKRAVRALCDMTDEDDSHSPSHSQSQSQSRAAHKGKDGNGHGEGAGTGGGLLESLLAAAGGGKNAGLSPGERLKIQLKLHHTATSGTRLQLTAISYWLFHVAV